MAKMTLFILAGERAAKGGKREETGGNFLKRKKVFREGFVVFSLPTLLHVQQSQNASRVTHFLHYQNIIIIIHILPICLYHSYYIAASSSKVTGDHLLRRRCCLCTFLLIYSKLCVLNMVKM
jgi:hypothetical protein